MKLYVAISHHGLGHLAQTAPVLNALHALEPGIEFVVRSALPRAALEARLAMPFEQVAEPSDCNLVMHDAIRVDVPASLAAYRDFHDGWNRKLDVEAHRLDALKIDAVYSNVGYLPLAAAQRAGRPAVAMCSLNWADIFDHYLGHAPGSGAILDQMIEAYAGARAFLRPEPAMPMAGLPNTVPIPPVVQRGRNRRAELDRLLGLQPGDRLVLVGMGGIRYRPPVERWPECPGVVYLVPDDWQAHHPRMRALRETGMAFRDVLASSDAVVTKPGYGTYVEAAAAAVPVLTIPRPDWPEAPYIDRWLAENVRMAVIPEADVLSGRLQPALQELWSRPPEARPVAADGVKEAARRLLELLKPGSAGDGGAA